MAKTSIKPNPITALIDPEEKASINAVTSEINKRIYSVAESFFIFMPVFIMQRPVKKYQDTLNFR